MKIKTFGYCLKQGTANLFKNRLMSVASIGTIASCVFIIGIFYIVVANVNNMVKEAQNNIGIAVFFEEETSEQRILEIKDSLELRTEVFSITYTSGDEAWNSFKEDYFDGREELLIGFDDDNPLEDSASLQIFLADISRQAALVDYINGLSDVRMVREERQVTDIIQNISELIQYVSIVLIAILILISVFLISNTVRLAIELRKKEINIMKYIGATDAFIRGPFIIEGATIGVIGAIIPLGIIYYFYGDAITKVIEQFMLLNDYLVFMPIDELLITLVPLSLGIGILIGIFGSMLTIHKHLRV